MFCILKNIVKNIDVNVFSKTSAKNLWVCHPNIWLKMLWTYPPNFWLFWPYFQHQKHLRFEVVSEWGGSSGGHFRSSCGDPRVWPIADGQWPPTATRMCNVVKMFGHFHRILPYYAATKAVNGNDWRKKESWHCQFLQWAVKNTPRWKITTAMHCS